MASRIPWTISTKASSWVGQLVTGFASVGSILSFVNGAPCQIGGTQENGDDAGLVGVVPGDGLCHLDTVAEVRGYEVGAYKQEDDLRSLRCCMICGSNSAPGDIAIVPGGDDVLAFEVTQVVVQFCAQRLILVGVGDEDFVCHGMLLCLTGYAEGR